MLVLLLGLINFCLLLLFGVYVSAAFSGVIFNKKNNFILLGFSFITMVLQTVIFYLYGMEITEKLYPFIIHLPLIVYLIFVYKLKPLCSIFAVLSAYLCCQLSKWISVLALSFSGEKWVAYTVKILMMLVIGFFIIRYIAPSVSVILLKSRKTILIFSILPISYYLFDYIATVYTDLLYSGSQEVFEFLPFVLCISYLLFCVVYFKEYEEKCKAERQNQLIEIQAVQSKKEIETIRRSEYEVSRLRHDMRHFLNNILVNIQNGAAEQAVCCINDVIMAINQTTLKKFCDNDLVNMVLSYFESCMKEQNIQLHASVHIAKDLPVSDMDFNSILANGLENAMQAVSILDTENRLVTLDLRTDNDKLLLSIKNPYSQSPNIVDGLPVAEEQGHGFGTQSIQYVTEKLKGNCQFTTKDNQFILRVVL